MMLWLLLAVLCLFLLTWSTYAIAGINAEKFLGKKPEKIDSVLSIFLFVFSLTGFVLSMIFIVESFK